MIEKFSIARDPENYLAWPDVAMGNGGKLVCVFSECDQHSSWREHTQIMLCESDDRGRTWSRKRPISERTTGGDTGFWNCPRITKLRDGRLAVVCDRMFSRENSAAVEQCVTYMFFSGDNGATWTEPRRIPVFGIVPDKLLELANGRWLIGSQYKDKDFGYLIQRVWFSDDSGDSWQGPFVIGKVKGLNLCEVSILPVEEALVAFMRENSAQGLDCFKSVSRDGGETWSEPVNFPLPGCHRPVAGFLDDGRIMITYRFLHGGKPKNGMTGELFCGALTDVESALAPTRGEAWTRIFPLDYDRAAIIDGGYSGWVQFDDGEVYVVNYIKDDSPAKAQIRGYSFKLEDIVFS